MMILGVSYHGSHLAEHMEADMDRMRDDGMRDVVMACQENDFKYMVGKIEDGPAIAHARGLRLYANFWGFACAFGGGRISKLLTDNPDVWLLAKDGSRQGHGCMNHPDLLARAKEQVDRCVETGYDGFFWDEPSRQMCYCRHCEREYEEKRDPPRRAGWLARQGLSPFPPGGKEGLSRSPTNLLDATPDEEAQFRDHCVVLYVERLSKYVKEKRPTLWTGTCVQPRDRASWESVAAIKELDMFGTDPYWILFRLFNMPHGHTIQSAVEHTRDCIRLARKYGKEANVWLNAWKIPAGAEQELYEGGLAMANERPDSFYTWSWQAGRGTSEASDNPDLIWRTVERLYKKISEND
jgi:hypothetical protein